MTSLEATWNDCFITANASLKKLKETEKVWENYKVQKSVIVKLLDDAEIEIQKIVPKHNQMAIQSGLKINKEIRDDIKRATDDLMTKMVELSETLATVASKDQQDEFAKEIQNLETRLKELLTACDEKIKNLEHLNIKWTNFNKNLAEMKSFVDSAKKNLNQITSLEMSPEDRLKMTKELQYQVKARIATLDELEKDAQFLFNDSANSPEVAAIKVEVESVKQDVSFLHQDVDKQSSKVSEDLQFWQKYRESIAQIKPWLEKAEVKMAIGLTKPSSLQDAKQEFDNLKLFNKESDDVRVKIEDIAIMSKKISCKTSAGDEVDALKSRQQSTQTAGQQWLLKIESLIESWNNFQMLKDQMQSWVEMNETILGGNVDHTNPDLKSLTTNLENIKKVLQEASQNQSVLINLTKEGDKVGSNLSHEGSGKIRGEISTLKLRISKLAEEAQKQIELISSLVNEKQAFQSQLDEYNNWMAEILLRVDDLNEIPVDQIEEYKEKAYTLSQEISDKQILLDRMQKEVAKSKDSEKGEEFTVQFNAISRQHSSALFLLEEKKQALSRWITFLAWHSESLSHMKFIQQTIDSHQTTPKEVETALIELENIAVQCQTRKIQGADDEETNLKSNTFILDWETHKPMSILLLVADILQKIVILKKAIDDKKGHQVDIDTKWNEFKETEQRIADWLQVVLSKVQKISVKNSNLESLENAATAVAGLLGENKEKEEIKNIYHDIGRYLMTHDTPQLKSIQEALTEADNKWRKVTNLLTEQQSKSQTLIAMWKQCIESKNIVSARLGESSDILEGLNETITNSSNETSQLLDKCKVAVSVLKKTRQPFEAFYKRQTQLISELNTVPGFDTSPIKKELSQVQQKFGFLGESLTKKMSNLDSIIVVWKQIEQTGDEILAWITDTKSNLQEALSTLSDTELAKIRLEKYKNDLNQYNSLKMGLKQKGKQLKKLNNEKENEAVPKISAEIEDQLLELATLATDLESALGNLGESAHLIKEEMKSIMGKLGIIREGILRCEDMSGSDEQLFERLNIVKTLQVDLSQFEEKISSIQEKIRELQEEFSSSDVKNLMKEYALLEKKFDTVNNQVNKLLSMFIGTMEKHYVEKVKDLTKFNSTFKEKISWCLPDPASDKYSLECKFEALSDIEETVDTMRPVLKELETCGNVIKQIVEDEKKADIEQTIKIFDDQLTLIITEMTKIKDILNLAIKSWQEFEESLETFSSWLKEIEVKIRKLSSTQVKLETFENEIATTKKILESVHQHSDEMKNLMTLARKISEQCPDSKVDQQGSVLQNRYLNVSTSLEMHLEKLQKVFQNKDLQNDTIDEYQQWLKSSKMKLKEFENRSSNVLEKKASDFKLIMADKENGNVLLEKAIEAGENIFSEIAPNDRDKIRTEIRALRDGWENHIDYMNSLNKTFETMLLEKSSLDERLKTIMSWFEGIKAKVTSSVDFGSNLSNKKSILASLKSLHKEISSQSFNLKDVSDHLDSADDSTLKDLVLKLRNEIESSKNNIENQIVQASMAVENHEKYEDLLNKAKDIISTLTIELSVLVDTPFETADAQKRIQSANNLLAKQEEGSAVIKSCQNMIQSVLTSNSEEGQDVLNKELDNVCMLWSKFLKNAQTFKEQQEKLTKKYGSFKTDLDAIIQWLKEMDIRVRDQPLRSDVESKTLQVDVLIQLQKVIEDKTLHIESVANKAEEIEGDSELSIQISQVVHKYELLKKNMKEIINKNKMYLKDHNSFNEEYESFKSWINTVIEDVKKHGDIVGDLRVLQERRNGIEELEDMRTSESIKFDSIIEQGEKLYGHTSPDGKEKIRSQLSELRNAWEKLAEEMVFHLNKIDICLQQFSDFTSAQEQLTKWLKDIEKHMQQHTELKPSFQEKKAQLQNHKIVHQEVTSHNSLVETVCTRAQALVDQTNDKSLNVYIDSIKALFQNIGVKSGDLMEKLEACLKDHTQYQSLTSGFSDFVSNQSDLLSQCADVSGEKADLERKKQILVDLKDNKSKGEIRVEELEAMLTKVMQSTAKRGCEKLRVEMAETKESWKTHLAVIEDVEINIEKALAYWDQFNDDLTKHHDWFKHYENIFRNQELLDTVNAKKEKLEELKSSRVKIIEHEKTIDDFVNNSHNLLHNSGVERLKPVITQISNRYQLLHVLSKEIVSKWQGIVEDHSNYSDKLDGIHKWTLSMETTIEMANKELDIEKKVGQLQKVLLEQETAPMKIANFAALGERLFPDTNSQGREQIRQELKIFRDKWDEILNYVLDQQKRQDTQLQHWSSYQDSLIQLTSWLDNIEASSKLDHVNWLNITEVKTKLLKFKSYQQDIVSHKRFVENINERAAAVINLNSAAPAEEIQEMLETINERYSNLKESIKVSVANMEEALDVLQNYHDLQRSHQDWQKQMWDKLSVYTDYTGNKHALDTRMEKIMELSKEINDGNSNLDKIKKHKSAIDSKKIPSKVQEAMEQDLSNVKYDLEKFTSSLEDVKQGINDRLRQWTEYETQLEKLISWLSETEGLLKNYSFKASLEEKHEQLEKYKVLL